MNQKRSIHAPTNSQPRLHCAGGIMLFLALHRAFDQVPRPTLTTALQRTKLDPRLQSLISHWHQSTHYHIEVNNTCRCIPVQYRSTAGVQHCTFLVVSSNGTVDWWSTTMHPTWMAVDTSHYICWWYPCTLCISRPLWTYTGCQVFWSDHCCNWTLATTNQPVQIMCDHSWKGPGIWKMEENKHKCRCFQTSLSRAGTQQ